MNLPLSPSVRVPIVLLAAGASERYGSIKQLAPFRGEPMVRRAARRLLSMGMPVVVVTGAHALEVETALTGLTVRIERHVGWAAGMGSSLAAGVRRAVTDFPKASGVLVCLADQPLLDLPQLRAMLQRHAVTPEVIFASTQDGIDGPPVLFPRASFKALVDWSGERGAKALLEALADRVERFVVRGGADVDTPEDLQGALLMGSNPDGSGRMPEG